MSAARGTIVAAGVTQTGLFQGDGPKPDKHQVQAELRSAMEIYKKNDVELILCEVRRAGGGGGGGGLSSNNYLGF